MSALDQLQARLQYRFRDGALLRQALTHRSHGSDNNERLEFLGDAALNLLVASLLYVARRAGLACAVASGASRALVGPGLQALGLAGEFAAVVAREDVARGKPAPDLFAEAARRLGVAPRACLAVDDAPEGVASARSAGMRVLTVIEHHLALPEDGSTAAANDGTPRHHPDQQTPSHDGTRPPDQGA